MIDQSDLHMFTLEIFLKRNFFSELCYTKMMISKNLLMTVRSTFQNLVGDFLKSTLHLYCPPSFSFTPNNDRDAVGWDLQISLLGGVHLIFQIVGFKSRINDFEKSQGQESQGIFFLKTHFF